MKSLNIALVVLALGSTNLGFAQSKDMQGMDMNKQGSSNCMDMMGKGNGNMNGMNMKDMDMQKCHDMKNMHDKSNKGASATQTHHATGVVKAINTGTNEVTLSHGPVKSLHWPAMTMTFKVKDKALLDKLSVDQRVQADIVKQGADYVVTSIK